MLLIHSKWKCLQSLSQRASLWVLEILLHVYFDSLDKLVCLQLTQGLTSNQTAHLIVGFIGRLIIIIPAWWQVNIRQLLTSKKDETQLVVIPSLLICFPAEDDTDSSLASICLQQDTDLNIKYF